MRTGKKYLFRFVLVAFAALAAAVPVASAAGGSPDDRGLYRGTSATSSPAGVTPDDRASYRGTSGALAPTSLSPDDRGFARSVGVIEPRTIPVAFTVTPGGFDWGDAAIGGTLGLGFALLGAGAILIGLRHRRGALRTA
jgi:hypothetical protein